MWKMLIADDEPIIRRGLKQAIDWDELNIEIVGEAEDGKMAIEKCRELKPNIVLVDICMPYLNGLELIEVINDLFPDTILLIITGHDEFNYAKTAVRLKVFDYVLKPVDEEELYVTIKKITTQLENNKKTQLINEFRAQAVEDNKPFIKSTFMTQMMNGLVSKEEIDEKLKLLGLEFKDSIGIFVIKPIVNQTLYDKDNDFSDGLLYFSMINIIEELLTHFTSSLVMQKNFEHVVGIVSFKNKIDWHELCADIEKYIELFIKRTIKMTQDTITDMLDFATTYNLLLEQIESDDVRTPVVVVAKKYIDQYFYKSDINLEEVAEYANVNPTYLSRLLKAELGNSFIDYLTKVRIRKAVEYMDDHFLKMYEIAELVGYNTQHYFSTAFKKVMGISPKYYKNGGRSRND